MISTPRRYLRVGLALVAAIDTAGLALLVYHTPPDVHRHPLAPLELLLFFHRPVVLLVLAGCGLWALSRFARSPSSLGAGLGALFVLAVLSEAHAASRGGPFHNYYPSGLTLLGWITGSVIARWSSRGSIDPDGLEAAADAGARGMLAAFYVNSVLSKLTITGFAWVNGTTLQAFLLAHGPEACLMPWLWHLMVDHRLVATGMQVFTLLAEGGAVLLLARSPLLRTVQALAIITMHLGILVTMHILYGSSALLVALFGIPWPQLLARVRRASQPALPEAPRLEWRAVYLMATGLAAFLAITLSTGLRQYTLLQERDKADSSLISTRGPPAGRAEHHAQSGHGGS